MIKYKYANNYKHLEGKICYVIAAYEKIVNGKFCSPTNDSLKIINKM